MNKIRVYCEQDGIVYEAEGNFRFRLHQFWLFIRVAFAALSPSGFSFVVHGDRIDAAKRREAAMSDTVNMDWYAFNAHVSALCDERDEAVAERDHLRDAAKMMRQSTAGPSGGLREPEVPFWLRFLRVLRNKS